MFFIRRYTLIFVLVIYTDWRFLQIKVTMIGAIVMTTYTCVARPFEERILNKQEVMNEVLVTFATYLLYAYTEILGDLDQLRMIGWMSIGLCGVIVAVNLTFMCCITLHTCKLRLKRYQTKK